MFDIKRKGILAIVASAGLAAASLTVGIAPSVAMADDASDPQELVSIRSYDAIDSNGQTMVDRKSTYQYADGRPVCPFRLMRDANNNEIARTDLVVYYLNNRVKGKGAVLLIKGIQDKGYTDSVRYVYNISAEPAGWQTSPSGLAVSLIPDQTWKGGQAITPSFRVKNKQNKILREGVDYTASFSNNKAVGYATLTIKGKNDYKGYSVSTDFKINKLDLSKCTMTATSAAYANGAPVPTTASLVYEGVVIPASGNYGLDYTNNTEPGKATVTANALPESKNVSGSKSVQYDITMPLSNANIHVASIPEQIWDGTPKKPTDLRVTYGTKELIQNVDYEIAGYNDNINPGRASIVLKGKGAYSGSRAELFYVKYKFSERVRVVLQSSVISYTGAPQSPVVLVTDPNIKDSWGQPKKLTEGVDYTIAWQALGGGASLSPDGRPQSRGMYKVVATGKGEYYNATSKQAENELTIQ